MASCSLSLELVHGRSLADVIREGPLSIADARKFGSEIAGRAKHAYERGVTHRDLKSTNVTNNGSRSQGTELWAGQELTPIRLMPALTRNVR